MNTEASDRACNYICECAGQVKDRMLEAVSWQDLPQVLFKPKLTIDGNQWCALYGDDLQNGVAGFGDSPYKAMNDFDNNWYKCLPPKKEETK